MSHLKLQRITLFFFPLFLFVLNLFSKFLFLNYEEIGLDEPFTIYHAQFGFGTIIEQLKNYNNPPLYELILHAWIKLVGISPLAVRILPLIFACCCPVALHFFGKRFFSLRVGIVSSLLLSFSDVLFYYSHDCRVYSLFLLLSLLSVYFFFDLLHAEVKKIRSVCFFVLASTLLIYAHYFGIFILMFQGAHLLLFYRAKLLKLSGYYLLILVLYLPHLFPLLTRMGHSVKNGTWLKPPNGLESLYNMLWSFSNFPFVTVVCLLILIAALIKAIKEKTFLTAQKNVSFVLTWFLFPFLGMFVISYWVPMYLSRYLIFALPAYYILLVLCVEFLISKVAVKNVVLVALILSFAGTLDLTNNKKQKMSAVAKVITLNKTPNTLVLITNHDVMLAFCYYYNRAYFSSIGDNIEYKELDSLLLTDNISSRPGDEHFSAADTVKYNRVILYADGGINSDPKQPLIADLGTLFKMDSALQFSGEHKLIFFSKK